MEEKRRISLFLDDKKKDVDDIVGKMLRSTKNFDLEVIIIELFY